MDSVFLLGSGVLWRLMALLVIGLQKLEPWAKVTPPEGAKK